jgi:tripartite-type tricarboxylate transporter receptor subunit TctC
MSIRQWIMQTLRVLAGSALALSVSITVPDVRAQSFPDRPITLVIPYGTGGGTDLAARILATEMSRVLGQPVIPKNQAGGGGAVALSALFAAKPDGYTIGVGTASNTAIIPHSTPVAYEALKFTYVASYFGWPYIAVVHPSVPVNTMQELVQWAKANPGKLVAVTTGGFNLHEIGMGLLADRSGGFRYRTLPTNSAAAGTARVLAGDANFATGSPVTYMQHVQAGTLKALAVVSDVSAPELDALKLPRTRDLFGYELVNTTVVLAPPGLPEPIRLRLEQAIGEITRKPEVIDALAKLNFPVQFAPGPEALRITRDISDIYRPVVLRMLEERKKQ